MCLISLDWMTLAMVDLHSCDVTPVSPSTRTFARNRNSRTTSKWILRKRWEGERWNEWVCSAALSRRRFPDSDVPQEYFRRQFWSKNDDLKTDVKMWQKKPETKIPIHFCGCRQLIIKWSQLGGHFLARYDLKLEFENPILIKLADSTKIKNYFYCTLKYSGRREV